MDEFLQKAAKQYKPTPTPRKEESVPTSRKKAQPNTKATTQKRKGKPSEGGA